MDKVEDGQVIEVDGDAGTIRIEGGALLHIESIPQFMQKLVEDGGLIKHVIKMGYGKENL